jgi:hypothetical protein
MNEFCEQHPRGAAQAVQQHLQNSTLPQNRQLNILISNSKQQVDDFAVELIF